MKNIKDMTKKELMELENISPKDETFTGIVIVPMNSKHGSGFQCMKYVLLNGWEIVGVIGGFSDVVHINGIGGYGKHPDYITKMVKAHDLRIDCLPKSKCLRLFSDDKMELWHTFCGSDFIFYYAEDSKEIK